MSRWFLRIVVIAAMVALIYGIDRGVAHFFSEQTLAPVLAILCFGGLIFVGSPQLILVRHPPHHHQPAVLV